MSATQDYIDRLTRLKAGDLGLLRTHAGQALDESVQGFDLFTGVWWPLRAKTPRAPRREVAWLIAKLYALFPVPQVAGQTVARQLRRGQPLSEPARTRFQQKLDGMLLCPLGQMEPALQWALGAVAAAREPQLDWMKLTDDLSCWELEPTRLSWAKEFLEATDTERE